MSDFINFVSRLCQMTQSASDDLILKLHSATISKGDFLLESGSVCRKLFFIDRGLAKTFFMNDDKEFIMQFFPENSMFTVLDSFTSGSPSLYSIVAMEQTDITYLYKKDLDKLCEMHHCIETFYRKLVSVACVNMMKRISEVLEANSTERYHKFVADKAALMQRINLGELANYLGITQVSLSRIRAKR